MEVNSSNFSTLLPEIEAAIEQSVYIGFDFELLGLPTAVDASSITLFDSVGSRYAKIRAAVKQISPCQFGIACFTESDKTIVVRSYWFPLFKANSSSSFSYSALRFLADNGYEFDRWIRRGLPFCNQDELSVALNKLLAGDLQDLPHFQDVRDKIDLAKFLIVAQAETDFLTAAQVEVELEGFKVRHSFVINLSSQPINYGDEDLPPKEFWGAPISPLEANYFLFCLNHELKPWKMQFVGDNFMLLKVTSNWETETEFKEEMKQRLIDLANGLNGVSVVFRLLVRHKAKLIGHNSLLDHIYLYQAFYKDLPESYETWKKAVNDMFPNTFDTKVLAKRISKSLVDAGLHDLSLHSLHEFFESKKCLDLLPQWIKRIAYAQSGAGDIELKLHNSAFDAAITGELFYKLALVCVKQSNNRQLSLSQLLPFVSSLCANLIPLPLIDSSFCNLAGEEPEGIRPDVIRLVKRPSNSKSSLSLRRCFFDNRAKISAKEVADLRTFLASTLGSFRFDIRLNDGNHILEISTNTASTYARMRNYFFNDDTFEMMPSSLKTKGDVGQFESNLLAHRVEKILSRKGSDRSKIRRCSLVTSTLFFVAVISFSYYLIKRTK